MKALSIKQPWASLIATGIKDIENRTWRCKFRGRIYIHAACKRSFRGMSGLNPEMMGALNDRDIYEEWDYPLGAIIGEVDIIDCVINHDSIWAEKMAYNVCPDTGLHVLRKGQKYVWNWVLANPVLYDKPIESVKGKLSFWEYNP